MAAVKDSYVDLERHRHLLSESVEKLRANLRTWQDWLLEYSALKEEVDTLPASGEANQRKDLARIRRDFDGALMKKREVDEIFGRVDLRSAEQISGLLARRIDYVELNLNTLMAQLQTVENRLAAVTVVAAPDAGTDEAGLPLTDIVEDLDDDDNVVSYSLRTPGDTQPQVVEVLKKVGVEDLPDITKKPEPKSEGVEDDGDEEAQPNHRQPTKPESPAEAVADGLARQSPALKKSVSFSEDTKPGHETKTQQSSPAAKRLEQVLQTAREQEALSKEAPVMPDDESAEDAQLRREMLEYGMSEIAPVVAELEIDEDSGDGEDYDYTDEDDADDDEDEFGMSKHSVITDEYRQQMKDLERRLGFQSSVGMEPARPGSGLPEEGIGRISVVSQPDHSDQRGTTSTSGKDPHSDGGKKKKGVRFAPDATNDASSEPAAEWVEPLGDVVERTVQARPMAEKPTKTPSRFKKQLAKGSGVDGEPAVASMTLPKGPQDAPTRFLDQPPSLAATPGPEGQTISDTIVEREAPSEVKEPDEFDAGFLHQEVAAEYNRRRNRLIQHKGGFTKEDESPIIAPDEEDGGPRRMSRFKAARLSKQ